MTISERVAYLKGLADGMELEKETSKESRMLVEMLCVLEDMGLFMEELEEAAELLNDLMPFQKISKMLRCFSSATMRMRTATAATTAAAAAAVTFSLK